MNHVERFRAVMNFEPVDRLPMWEWAMWWDKTIARWHSEGLPAELKGVYEISQYFGMDPYYQYWFDTADPSAEAAQHHVQGGVSNMDDYEIARTGMFPDHTPGIEGMGKWRQVQAEGNMVVWITLGGFFWTPRSLMGFEKLMYAFYDQPELIHRMNRELLEFNLNIVRKLPQNCVPTFCTVAEDMSYNHGPMISEQIFDEFLAPYYRQLTAALRELNIIPIVDTDGDVTRMVPWLEGVGVAGVLPLERQAGVDAGEIRDQFPKLNMIGHFDKMVMKFGEQAMRAEFERLLPIMKRGGFIPSVDHQTPPDVPLENYRIYLRLLAEYTAKV